MSEIETRDDDTRNYLRIHPQDVDFNGALPAHKVTDDYVIQYTGEAKDWLTEVGEHLETRNRVNPGDWLVYNIGAVDPETIPGYDHLCENERMIALCKKAECYVQKPEVFANTHHPIDADRGLSTPKKVTRLAMQVPFNFVIRAPWGSEEYVKAGGYIIKDGEDVYGIAQKPFERTYAAAHQNQPFIETSRNQMAAGNSPIPGIAFTESTQDTYRKGVDDLCKKHSNPCRTDGSFVAKTNVETSAVSTAVAL